MHEIEYLMYWYLRSAPAELQHLVPAWATPVTTTSTHLYGNTLTCWCVCVWCVGVGMYVPQSI